MKKRIINAFIFLCLFSVLIPVFAVSPEQPPVPWVSYNYGVWEMSIDAAPAYDVDKVKNGKDWGIGSLSSPKDMCRDNEGNIYILDSGNNRVIVVNKDMEFVKAIDTFYNSANTVIDLVEPSGICVDVNGKLYIADKGLKSVIVCEQNGKIDHRIIKPVTDLIDEDTEFLPNKILVDKAGVVYVLSTGCYEGAYTFDSTGDFLGFYGSNKVAVTAKLQADRLWRMLSTDEQKERMYRYVPVEYNNFSIDKDGFVYTVSNYGDNEQRGQVRKLNPMSQNILFAGRKPNLMYFGDWETVWTTRVEKSMLVAVDVDEKDFINVLDFERGRIFQYDQMCNLIAIWGGIGNQEGSFKNAVDLLSFNDKVYVLDNVKGNLTSFKMTRFGQAIHEATILYEDGYYEEALQPWFDALKIDRNNYLTLRGIGRAYERMEDYENAMAYYKQSINQTSYSESFQEWRTNFLRKHFGTFMIILLLLLCFPFIKRVIKSAFAKEKKIERTVFVSKLKFPFYLIAHPFKGWEELKKEKQGSLLYANIIILLLFILDVVQMFTMGFQFNVVKEDEVNILINFATTVGIALLWSICNWAVCTLQDGKGTFKEVWIFTCYSMLFKVLCIIPFILLSNVLTEEEALFGQLFDYIITGYTGIQILLAIKAAHQYTMGKTIGSIALTIVAMLLILIIILLFVSLFSQVWTFGSTIVQELLMRF